MNHRLLIAEPQQQLAQTLRKFLEGGGFKCMRVGTFEDALIEVREAEPDLLLTSCSPAFNGEELCRQLKKAAPGLPVVLLYPPEQEDPEAEANASGADAYLVAPLKKGTVLSCARTMVRLRALNRQVSSLEADLKKHVAELSKDAADAEGFGPRNPEGGGASGSDFEFFKRFLLIEIKRSRRYRYPVSFLLMGLDHFPEKTASMSQAERTRLLAEALSLLSRGVRDIDLAVPYIDGRFLVFLPHTPRDGAAIVAIRARERMARLEKEKGITASIGIASYEPDATAPQISFGTLMKEAAEALKKAQATGGNKIEGGGKVRRNRVSLG